MEINTIIKPIRGLIKDTGKTVRNAFEYVSDSSFKLSDANVDDSTIKVFVNGADITDANWSFNEDTNKVTISSTLTEGDTVIIVFVCYEKYSNAEITSYIEANLVRFTQKRYKKSFSIEDDEIVDADGESPTKAEGDVIAIVTAIDIDPQNVEIRTRDFTVTASENKSKSEQFNEVFAQFDRGFVSLDFLEIDEENL
jgi:hypothetical protein